MKVYSLIVVICLASCNRSAFIVKDNNKITGMWKLLTVEKKDSIGQWKEDTWMKGGTGFIIYDAKGHMAVQMTPADYENFTWLSERDNTIEEKIKAKIDSLSVTELKLLLKKFSSDLVYFANYKIREDTNIIEHKRISHSNPSAWNTKVERSFQINGDTLVLQLPDGFRRLIWKKQK